MLRGRGRGGLAGAAGGMSHGAGLDDPPARSLARKVDAGGNAVMPDLMPLSPAVSGSGGSGQPTADEDVEEGEREEGEMDASEDGGEQPRSRQLSGEAGAMETGDQGYALGERERERPRGEDMAPSGSPAHASADNSIGGPGGPGGGKRSLHLGQLPARQSFLPHSHSHPHHHPHSGPGSSSGSGNNTPNTPVAPMSATSGAGSVNPYSASAWQRSASMSGPAAAGAGATPSTPASASATATAAAAGAPAPKQPAIPTYTAAHFPRSAQPEWDAELWTLSAHRLAGLTQLPVSWNYYLGAGSVSSAQGPGAGAGAGAGAAATPDTPAAVPLTPGLAGGATAATSGPAAAAASLRAALLDLKDASLEMEMSNFRREELERRRAELV